jgi:hypothetical protein
MGWAVPGWLRAGALAAERLYCSQSTVSRNNTQFARLRQMSGTPAAAGA